MEIKVLGTGCSSCKTLYETTKQAISELGSDATLIKEEDLLKIFFFSLALILLSVQISLVRFGYINKGINLNSIFS